MILLGKLVSLLIHLSLVSSEETNVLGQFESLESRSHDYRFRGTPATTLPEVLSIAQPLHAASSEEVSANFSPEFSYSQNQQQQHFPHDPANNNPAHAYQEHQYQDPSESTGQRQSPYGINYGHFVNSYIQNITAHRMCPKMTQFEPDFDSTDVFPKLGFHDAWIRQKWFWQAENFDFEKRFQQKFQNVTSPPRIKVIVVPHSHSDPGWLKTFEGYFHSQTRHTLDLAVEKLMIYPNMTFVWNEISFLSLWWKSARVNQKIQFLQLVNEGRLEVLTGGWVMADEATVNLYSLIDELVEGRQWVNNFLGIVPNISWSIDPFGHGSVMPYILKTAGINNMVIQRLHYAWKKYLAQKQFGNFKWVQRWDTAAEFGITSHNAPYDVYTTKHTCGPNPNVCLRVDFRNILGEYSEYTRHARPIRELDLDSLAVDLVGQFQRTSSLTPSRTVLFPLGDDFRFDKSEEWDQQYENYVPLMNHINANYHRFGVEILFGTVSDYFRSLESENLHLPTFSGDFFPYSDVFVSGRPAYWTGFYSTRPYWKKFYRETENHLRTAEILYTHANNLAADDPIMSVILQREYENLIQARRHVALFSHHDGTTGTSRKATMDDYGHKLMEATRSSLQIQRQSIRAILRNGLNLTTSSLGIDSQILSFGEMPTKVPRVIYENNFITKKIIVFNSLSFRRTQLVKVRVTSPVVKVVGSNEQDILSQINPVIYLEEDEIIFSHIYELSFLADLEPLTLHVFEIRRTSPDDIYAAQIARVSCRGCRNVAVGSFPYFETENITTPTIVLGNREQELYFNGSSGFLLRVTKLQEDITTPFRVQFGGYKSVFRDSGAYLLNPDENSPVQIPFDESRPSKLLLVEGRVTSYLTAFNDPLTVTTRLLGISGQGIHVENVVDLESTAAEVYMRVDTWMNSTTTSVHGQKEPTLYTDQNGYTIEKRMKVPWIAYQGNVYPVNTMAYIQDVENFVRFSILVDRAHGFNSMHSGRLETLIERRTPFDDGRGMSEGVTDNKRTISNYIFLLENLGDKRNPKVDPEDGSDYSNNLPTLNALHLSLGLNYASTSFGHDDSLGSFLGKYSILTKPMPQDSHLLTLRTVSNVSMLLEEELPSERALLIVQKLGHLTTSENGRCNGNDFNSTNKDLFNVGTRFTGLDIESADITDLAGVLGVHYSGRRSTLPTVERRPFEITSFLVSFKQRQSLRRRVPNPGFHRHHQRSFENSAERFIADRVGNYQKA